MFVGAGVAVGAGVFVGPGVGVEKFVGVCVGVGVVPLPMSFTTVATKVGVLVGVLVTVAVQDGNAVGVDVGQAGPVHATDDVPTRMFPHPSPSGIPLNPAPHTPFEGKQADVIPPTCTQEGEQGVTTTEAAPTDNGQNGTVITAGYAPQRPFTSAATESSVGYRALW